MAAAYFAAVVLDIHSKLKVMVGYALKAAKRLFGIPNFHYYAIADGLNSIFQRCPGRISLRVPPVNNGQLQLLDFGPWDRKKMGEVLTTGPFSGGKFQGEVRPRKNSDIDNFTYNMLLLNGYIIQHIAR